MFDYDSSVERIPLANLGTLLANLTFRNEELGSVWDIEGGEHHSGSFVNKTQLRLTAYYNRFFTIIGLSLNRTQILEGDLTRLTGGIRVLRSGITSHTTRVECTEGKLRTRLANCLSSNHADSLALLHHLTSSQVTAIALSAYTMFGFASQYRTNLHSLDACIYDALCLRLADLFTC